MSNPPAGGSTADRLNTAPQCHINSVLLPLSHNAKSYAAVDDRDPALMGEGSVSGEGYLGKTGY